MAETALIITDAAAARLKSEADFSRSALTIRMLLGCGGTGFRISVEENPLEEGRRFTASGIPVVMEKVAEIAPEGDLSATASEREKAGELRGLVR